MSNARFSILQAKAISDKKVSDAQFRTLAALGMYADQNGWCFPSLKTLGKNLNKSAQAVGRDTIALRKLGYLQVKNRYDAKTKSRHSNLYRLIFDFNVDDSTLSTPDVDTLSTPDVDTLSTPDVDTLSTPDVEVNDPINDPINNNDSSSKQKPVKKDKLPENSDLAFLLAVGQDITDEAQQETLIKHNALVAFEASFNAPKPLAWFCGKPKWTELRKDVVALYKADPQCFEKYKVWRLTPYAKGTVSLKDIQRDPDCFMASWAGFSEANQSKTEIERPEQKQIEEWKRGINL